MDIYSQYMPPNTDELEELLSLIDRSFLARSLPPSLFESFIEFNENDIAEVKKDVTKILRDKNMLQMTLKQPISQNVLTHNKIIMEALKEAESSLSRPLTVDEVIVKWQRLNETESFKCSICHDILAAPCLLPCSHTFCGECLKEKDRVQALDADVQLECSCPECRATSTNNHRTFERKLDALISDELLVIEQSGVVPKCILKEILDWKRKRNHYLNRNGIQLQKDMEPEADASIDDKFPYSYIIYFALAIFVFVAVLRKKS